MTTRFATRLLAWFDEHGRKDLPWQQSINPYRVWVSEIMLQQTQVTTVIDYFTRFMQQFPDVHALAAAPLDEVLHLWTGLGYYARARNLHRAATRVCDQHAGKLPKTHEALTSLPGIGRSTAGAISAIAHQQREAILDGNVKRVLARFYAIPGWPGEARVLNALWAKAEENTPKTRVADYTQAIMDLGAMICKGKAPECPRCPLQSDCKARATDTMAAFPGRKPKKALPVKKTDLLMVRTAEGEVLLEKRPAKGIWGGLWSFPEYSGSACAVKTYCHDHFACTVSAVNRWEAFRHTFSHYHLEITPLHVEIQDYCTVSMDPEHRVWYKLGSAAPLGLAAPIKRLLHQLESETHVTND